MEYAGDNQSYYAYFETPRSDLKIRESVESCEEWRGSAVPCSSKTNAVINLMNSLENTRATIAIDVSHARSLEVLDSCLALLSEFDAAIAKCHGFLRQRFNWSIK